MNIRLVFASIFISLGLVSAPATTQVTGERTGQECLDVTSMKAPMTVSGTLIERQQIVPTGKVLTYFIELPEPICVDDGGNFADPTNRFSRVHIILQDEALLEVLGASLGRAVSVTGEGFAEHTAHHHAPLVIMATSITVR